MKLAHHFHRHPLDAQRSVQSARPSEVNDQLLGFDGTEGEVVVRALLHKEFQFLRVVSDVVSSTNFMMALEMSLAVQS